MPRIVNVLSHKSLLVAYGRGLKEIDHKAVQVAVRDTLAAKSRRWSSLLFKAIIICFALLLAAFLVDLIGNI